VSIPRALALLQTLGLTDDMRRVACAEAGNMFVSTER
jgi:hypothetical protein